MIFIYNANALINALLKYQNYAKKLSLHYWYVCPGILQYTHAPLHTCPKRIKGEMHAWNNGHAWNRHRWYHLRLSLKPLHMIIIHYRPAYWKHTPGMKRGQLNRARWACRGFNPVTLEYSSRGCVKMDTVRDARRGSLPRNKRCLIELGTDKVCWRNSFS